MILVPDAAAGFRDSPCLSRPAAETSPLSPIPRRTEDMEAAITAPSQTPTSIRTRGMERPTQAAAGGMTSRQPRLGLRLPNQSANSVVLRYIRERLPRPHHSIQLPNTEEWPLHLGIWRLLGIRPHRDHHPFVTSRPSLVMRDKHDSVPNEPQRGPSARCP